MARYFKSLWCCSCVIEPKSLFTLIDRERGFQVMPYDAKHYSDFSFFTFSWILSQDILCVMVLGFGVFFTHKIKFTSRSLHTKIKLKPIAFWLASDWLKHDWVLLVMHGPIQTNFRIWCQSETSQFQFCFGVDESFEQCRIRLHRLHQRS